MTNSAYALALWRHHLALSVLRRRWHFSYTPVEPIVCFICRETIDAGQRCSRIRLMVVEPTEAWAVFHGRCADKE